jgi:hypothetical protein
LQLPGPDPQHQRLVQGRPHLRVAPASADLAEDGQRLDPADRRRPWVAEHDLDGADGLGPASLLEGGPGLRHQQVQPQGVQVALGAVADPFLAVAGGQRVLALVEGGPGEVGVGAGNVLLKALGPGQGQAPLQHGQPGRPPRTQLGGADVVESMDQDLGLAEPLGQLDRAAAPGNRLIGVPGQHGQLG